MNMWGWIKSSASILLVVFLASCAKDDQHYYVYQVDDQEIGQPGAEKPNVKTSTEYISIAYADAFGSTIANTDLEVLKTMYISFGGVGVIEDLIIRNMLNASEITVPTQQEMEADYPAFVEGLYKQIYNRLPSSYEQWYVAKQIEQNDNATPELVYYALMTSNEYRQY